MPDNALFVGPLDRVLSLKTLPMLEALPSRELVAMAQTMRERFVPRGAQLLRAGQSMTTTYLILDGGVELTTADGQRAIDGETLIGLLELLAQVPFSADAHTTADTLVLELDADQLEDLWEDRFPIMLEHIKYLARETSSEFRERGDGHVEEALDAPAMTLEGPLNLVELILTLCRIPMLSSESIDALAELSRHLTEMHVDRGDPLWRQDDAADQFWILLSGRARLRSTDGSAGLPIGPGACVGLEEMLAGSARWNDCLAEAPLVTLRIAREPFVDVLEEHFPMARHVVTTMARQLLTLRSRGR